jgi:hypothetical protein
MAGDDARGRLRALSAALGTLREVVGSNNTASTPEAIATTSGGSADKSSGRAGAQDHVRVSAELVRRRATVFRLAFAPVEGKAEAGSRLVPPTLDDCRPAADMLEEAVTALVAGVVGVCAARGSQFLGEESAEDGSASATATEKTASDFWVSEVLAAQLRLQCTSVLSECDDFVKATEAQFAGTTPAPASLVGRVWAACKPLESITLSNASALRNHANTAVLPLLKDSVRELTEEVGEEVADTAKSAMPHLLTIIRCSFMIVKQAVEATRAIDGADSAGDAVRLGSREDCLVVDRTLDVIRRLQETIDDLVASFEMMEDGDELSGLFQDLAAVEALMTDASESALSVATAGMADEESSDNLRKMLAGVQRMTSQSLEKSREAFEQFRSTKN